MIGAATPGVQLSEWLWGVGWGLCLGAAFGLYGFLRLIFCPGRVLAFAADVLFCAAAGVATFLFDLGLTGGRLRGYWLLGVAVGFIADRVTVGRWLSPIARRSAAGLRRIGGQADRRITAAAAKIGRVTRTVCSIEKFRLFFKKALKRENKVVYNQRK